MNDDHRAARMLALACVLVATATAGADEAGDDDRDGARRAAVRAAGEYRHCLLTQAQRLVTEVQGPRALAQAAARACEPVLTALDETLADEPLSAPERRWFVTSVRRNTLRRTLPELMALAAGGGRQAP